MFQELPTEQRFYFNPGATIYMPERVVPTVLRGQGHMTLRFEPTPQRHILSIQVRDLFWQFHPFAIPVDLERRGRYESLEFGNVALDLQYLDQEATRGSLNLETGELEIAFVYLITPKQIPLLEQWGGTPLRFTVTDRGKMDLRKGTFEIHSDVLQIDHPVLAGALFKGGGTGTISGGEPSTLDLSVVVAKAGATGCGEVKQKEVTICKGDQVILCWTSSSDVTAVEIFPAPGTKQYASPGWDFFTPTQDTLYQATGVGTKLKAEVKVHLYAGEWLGPYEAEADGWSWSIEIPATSLSRGIRVQEIELQKGCLDWSKFLLEHVPPGQTSADFGRSIQGFNAIQFGSNGFNAVGKWVFSAQADPPRVTPKAKLKESLPVCFKFRGVCTK